VVGIKSKLQGPTPEHEPRLTAQIFYARTGQESSADFARSGLLMLRRRR
jgi:hypothetical protein